MVQAVADADIKQIVLNNATFGPADVNQITEALARDLTRFSLLRDAVGELERQDATPAMNARLGVCQYVLGRYAAAIQSLKSADNGALAYFYLGKSFAALEKYADALAAYASAHKAGYPTDQCALAKTDAQRASGDLKAALATLDALSGAVEQTAEYLYQRGATVAAISGNPTEVVALFERAVEVDPHHSGACSAWRWKTTVTATTTRRSSSTNGACRGIRPTSGRCSTSG